MQCPPLNITFLGTGTSSGVPMIGCTCPVCTSADPKDKRLRSSILVESPATTFVVDTTPDFRY
ncbi:MAG TPA: MBL fold metallo-hydrolase, partial [Ferruginibacter sp.]|nr:MBL fold metallo-hydrolase [Ferruginibacter sp.]